MCNIGRLYTAISENMPVPAWIKYPQTDRFCCCCSIRTGASFIGWFTFILNALYTGLLMFALGRIRNDIQEAEEMFEMGGFSSGMDFPVVIDTSDYAQPSIADFEHTTYDAINNVRDVVIPTMYKTVCVPAMMIIFSVLWLTAVESRTVTYIKIVGHSFIFAIILQLILQLALLSYADVKSRQMDLQQAANPKFGEEKPDYQREGVHWIVWLIYVIYAVLNLYYIPVLREFIKRRVKEFAQGIEQGLLTSDMFPRARVAEAYIEDAFTLDNDVDATFKSRTENNDNDEVQQYSSETTKAGYQQM